MNLIDLTKARASFYSFLNIHFMQLPDASFVRMLRHTVFCSVLKDLAQHSETHPEIAHGASLMNGYLVKTMPLQEAELAKQLGVDRTRLYRGLSPDYGPPPPYEALWRSENEAHRVLRELAAVYAGSGFTLNPELGERLDYIGIQIHYMEALVAEEISARDAGDEGRIHETLQLEKNFLRNHWDKWVPGFASIAIGRSRTDFYRGHLHLLLGFTEQEKRVLMKPG